MNLRFLSLIIAWVSVVGNWLVATPPQVFAQAGADTGPTTGGSAGTDTSGLIQNPVLQGSEGAYGEVAANPLAPLIARLWQTIVVAGALMVIVMLVWGALDWLMSEGDPEKLKNAKNKIIHTMFGIGLLAASFAVVWFIRTLFGFDLLKLAWPTPTQ